MRVDYSELERAMHPYAEGAPERALRAHATIAGGGVLQASPAPFLPSRAEQPCNYSQFLLQGKASSLSNKTPLKHEQQAFLNQIPDWHSATKMQVVKQKWKTPKQHKATVLKILHS